MIALTFNSASICGARIADLDRLFPGTDRVRQIERASIRVFMERHRAVLKGRVLDFGAGKEPYRALVKGDYISFDKGQSFPGPYGSFDAVMCNQVIQYVGDPAECLSELRSVLRVGGHLLITYPVNWDEVETSDLWRFTKSGMERLLKVAGFEILVHERRAEVRMPGITFPLGYGALCRRSDVHAA